MRQTPSRTALVTTGLSPLEVVEIPYTLLTRA
jgi:hypothetical protein